MILCEVKIIDIATLLTALSSLITGFYLWYDRRARIIVSIEPIDRRYYLTIENVGKSVAKDVKIGIDKSYINSLPVSSRNEGYLIKKALQNIQERKFYYTPGTKKYYLLMQCPKANGLSEFDLLCNDWYEKNKYRPFSISVTYNNWFDYRVEFFLEQFNSDASIPHTEDYWYLKHIETIKNILREKL